MKEVSEMRGTGAIIFLIVFAILTVVTLSNPTLPFGQQIYEAIGGVGIDQPILGIPVDTLVPAVFNGIVYGFIVWLLYTIASAATGGDKKDRQTIQQTVSVQVQPEKDTAPPQIAPSETAPPAEPEVPLAEVSEPQEDVTPKSVPLLQIEGIGPVYCEKLAAEGVRTSADLLEAGKTRTGRGDLAKKTNISGKLILSWVNLSDLIRIKGISEQYSDLLEEAGVDTVVELARRNPDNLYAKLQEVNAEKKLVRRLPAANTVADWIAQAKQLPRMVEH
jgi:predicted flap endonuclease-1-like 5' DNA nuclease